MASIFHVDENADKTNVLLLGDGNTYMPVSIIPVSGGSEISNARSHAGGLNAIVTGINVECISRVQFAPTLGTDIFAYTFGEDLYSISVSGMGFTPCGGKASIDDLITFWDDNNMGKHGKACAVVFNSKIFKAYLLQGDIGATEQAMGMFPFRFSFQGVLT